jgi:glycosyltransferase involved in cell wall biosynthesis
MRLLRLAGVSSLITAASFEHIFREQIGQLGEITMADPEPWFQRVLGPLGAPPGGAAERLRAATTGFDFVCPGHQAIPLAPMLVALRNQARLSWRLLFIAHAAASYHREWLLLQGQLVPGDLIIAPSQSAWDSITFLAPDLLPFLRMIPHPIAMPARRGIATKREIISLGRIHVDKLLHRQIDAYALLRRRSRAIPPMSLYGSLDDQAGVTPSAYARSLQARITRLGLRECVSLRGAVTDPSTKATILEQAHLLVNLSVTLEESCPKAPLEAQSHGTPVLGTSWNGLRDTIGPLGALVPVSFDDNAGERLHVAAEDTAIAMATLLDSPPAPDAVRAWAAKFAPSEILPRYRDAMRGSVDTRTVSSGDWPAWPGSLRAQRAAPTRGLLSTVAILRAVSMARAFSWYEELVTLIREGWLQRRTRAYTDAEAFYASVERALTGALQRAAATGSFVAPAVPSQPESPLPDTAPFTDVLARGATGERSVSARAAATRLLWAAGDTVRAHQSITRLRGDHPAHREAMSLYAEWTERHETARQALVHLRRGTLRTPWDEDDGARLRQFARLARHSGEPMAADEPLAAWLERFPDALDSGSIWLELAICRIRGNAPNTAIDDALASAARLLGDGAALRKAHAERQFRLVMAVAQ